MACDISLVVGYIERGCCCVCKEVRVGDGCGVGAFRPAPEGDIVEANRSFSGVLCCLCCRI